MKNVLIETVVSKTLYKELLNRVITPPTVQLNFNSHFVNDVLEWKEIYSLSFRTSLDTKLREFQYKLLNRCLVTNSFLNKIGIIPSPACSFFAEMNESLEHFIICRRYSKDFCAEVLKWFDDQGVTPFWQRYNVWYSEVRRRVIYQSYFNSCQTVFIFLSTEQISFFN